MLCADRLLPDLSEQQEPLLSATSPELQGKNGEILAAFIHVVQPEINDSNIGKELNKLALGEHTFGDTVRRDPTRTPVGTHLQSMPVGTALPLSAHVATDDDDDEQDAKQGVSPLAQVGRTVTQAVLNTTEHVAGLLKEYTPMKDAEGKKVYFFNYLRPAVIACEKHLITQDQLEQLLEDMKTEILSLKDRFGGELAPDGSDWTAEAWKEFENIKDDKGYKRLQADLLMKKNRLVEQHMAHEKPSIEATVKGFLASLADSVGNDTTREIALLFKQELLKDDAQSLIDICDVAWDNTIRKIKETYPDEGPGEEELDINGSSDGEIKANSTHC